MTVTTHRPALILGALASGFAMASIDSTVVNVAAVSIGDDLGSQLNELTWVVDGYVLTFAALLLLGGSLATSFGSKRAYVFGLSVFAVASLAGSLAPSTGVLISARAAQGIGAALFMPSSLSLLVAQFSDPLRRAKMLGLWSAIVATGAAIGPTLGGVLVGSFGWRTIFLINLPVALVGLVLTMRVIPSDHGTGEHISVWGHLNVLLSLASVAFVLIQGHASGLRAPAILGAVALFIVSTGVLVVHQFHTTRPAIPWTMFGNAAFALPNIVGFVYSAGLFGTLYLMGLFLQAARGATPLQAGLQMLPMTLCFPLGNAVYTRIHHRVSNAAIMAVCLMVAAIATLLLIRVDSHTHYWYFGIPLAIANSGAGLVTASMTAATVAAAGEYRVNYAGAALNTNRQIGVLMGVAVVGLILQSTTNWYVGLHISVAVVAGCYATAAAAAVLLMIRMRRDDTTLPSADHAGCPR